MIFEEANIIFLHPGKTGGSSITKELKDLHLPKTTLDHREENFNLMYGYSKKYKIYLQHADLFFLKKMCIDVKKYNTFVSIRRPYERLLSTFYYNNLNLKFNFKDFVSNHLEKFIEKSFEDKKYSTSHISPQINFCKCENYSVDNFIKLENFSEDCKKIGISGKYHIAKTKCSIIFKNYMDAYDQKTKDIVYSLYKEDFITLEYKK